MHTRAHPITLDTLLAYDLGMPDLYDRLATQNILHRGTYKRGPHKPPLKLINDKEFQDGNLELELDQEASEDDDDMMGLGEEDSRPQEAMELEHSEDDTESPGMNEIISTGHRSRYNLRSRQVNSAILGHFENVPTFTIETKKKPQVSSILYPLVDIII